MKPSRLFSLAAVFLAASPAAAALPQETEAPAEGIRWVDGLDAAFARSREDGAPVLAYFTFET